MIEPPAVVALLEKIRRTGTPLRDVVGISPLNGIKTGLNEAFLIDTPTRDRLVEADIGCVDIIRPYLRGQDIDRWHAGWANLWMIVIKSSSDYAWPWADAGDNAERIFSLSYPALYSHIKPFEEKLRNRQDHGRYWWELRPCSYYNTFDRPKIMYQAIQYYPKYIFDELGMLGNNKTYIIPCKDLLLISVLNSPIFWWFSWRFFIHMKDEALSNDAIPMEGAPIPPMAKGLREGGASSAAEVIDVHRKASAALAMLIDWYRAEHGIERPSRALAEPFKLDVDAFVAELRRARGARRPLTPAGVAAAREAWRETVAPIRERLREAERLERDLSDLVNAAYGLTPEEVRLMWETAPPRMPLPAPCSADGASPQRE